MLNEALCNYLTRTHTHTDAQMHLHAHIQNTYFVFGGGAAASGKLSFFGLMVPLVAVQLDLSLTLQMASVGAV